MSPVTFHRATPAGRKPSGVIQALGLLLLWQAACSGDAAGTKPTTGNRCTGQASCDAGNSTGDGDTSGDGDGDGHGDGDAPHDAGEDEVLTPSEPLAGCTPERRAIPLYPDAAEAQDVDAEGPLTCAMGTGKRAPFNTTVAANRNGSVFYAPAEAAGVVRTRDNGKTWQGPLNNPPGESEGNWGHPWLWRDPVTERLFFTLYNSFAGPCPDLSAIGTAHNAWWSDDDGDTWHEIEGGIGCGSWDWGKIVTGPARRAETKEALKKNGYPNVVYFCAGGPTYAIGPNHFCFRSVDGGLSFVRTKSDAIDYLGRGESAWPNGGYVAPDGTFYKAYPSEQGLALSMSEDEGDSWRSITVPKSRFANGAGTLNFLSSNVTGDEEGNLYVGWIDDDDLNPRIAYSRDRGVTWSDPIHVGGIGVRAAACINLSVKRPGYVAVAYYGSPKAEGSGDGHTTNDMRPYDAYLTVSTNVFTERPLFWSTTINQPGTPALQGLTLLVSEYVGAPAFAPDGSVWVGFLDQEAKGLVGRMTPPPAAVISSSHGQDH